MDNVVPVAVAVFILTCLAYPIVLGYFMVALFVWGVLAVFIPKLRV